MWLGLSKLGEHIGWTGWKRNKLALLLGISSAPFLGRHSHLRAVFCGCKSDGSLSVCVCVCVCVCFLLLFVTFCFLFCRQLIVVVGFIGVFDTSRTPGLHLIFVLAFFPLMVRGFLLLFLPIG